MPFFTISALFVWETGAHVDSSKNTSENLKMKHGAGLSQANVDKILVALSDLDSIPPAERTKLLLKYENGACCRVTAPRAPSLFPHRSAAVARGRTNVNTTLRGHCLRVIVCSGVGAS